MGSLAARALPLAVALLACIPHVACSKSLDQQPLSPTQTKFPPAEVQVTDPEGLDRLRAAGTHDIRGPFDEVGVSVACTSGAVDDACVEAARQRLREASAARDANLAVIVGSAAAQSFPVQYSVTAQLYEMTER